MIRWMTFLLCSISLLSSAQAQWQMSSNMTDHDVYAGANCVAFVAKAVLEQNRRRKDLPAGVARLEVIAQADAAGGFKEPFVQAVFKKGADIPETFQLTMKNGNKVLTLDRLFIEGRQDLMVYAGKLEERQELIAAIKDLSVLALELKKKNATVAQVQFNLTGSGRAVSQQFEDCRLSFADFSPIQ